MIPMISTKISTATCQSYMKICKWSSLAPEVYHKYPDRIRNNLKDTYTRKHMSNFCAEEVICESIPCLHNATVSSLVWEAEESEQIFKLVSPSNWTPKKPWSVCPFSINLVPCCYILWSKPWENGQWQTGWRIFSYQTIFFLMGRCTITFDSVLHNSLFRKCTERNNLALVKNWQMEWIGLFPL